MEWQATITLFSIFIVLMAFSVPISFAIGIATMFTFMVINMSFDQAIFIVAQQMASGLDSFTLLAIPFFILAGNIMNRGGIAMRLIEFCQDPRRPSAGLAGPLQRAGQHDVRRHFRLCRGLRRCSWWRDVAAAEERGL
ncbi:TRAP transporter large permease subunit [uncultured Cohaesibacter sp.]|uniref:TRAP transporter large permease subunit n=1 Tax=uncultured Cohaesibacter sp. TaxID=1002546 RepID=UPI0029C7E56F|nr:TRAP transporter large permease subunit [uncultured Cohaesibacter sp.]